MLRTRAVTVLLAILVLSVFITPWRRELYVGDETKYGQVVREVRAGAFFLPTLHGTPFTHKPPLHFWLIDLLTYPFGLYSLWPFVLPSLIAYVALLWVMWKMGGPLAAFVCGTSLMVWGSAQTARMDVSFTLFLALAAWMIRRFIEDHDRRALLLAGVAVGIATLIKGPMAPVIAALLLLFEIARRRKSFDFRLSTFDFLPALAAAVIIPLLWFVPATRLGGDAYTREVLVKQTAGRAVGSWVHKAEPWFYVAHAPADLFPWFFLTIVALVAAYRRHDEEAKFYVSWILAVFVPYTLMSSKLDIYMMALIPPVALLIARMLTSGVRDDMWRWAWRANILTIGILLGAGIAALIVVPKRVIGPEAALVARPDVRGVFITLIVTSSIALIYAIRRRDALQSTFLAGSVPLATLIYVALALIPVANEVASTRPLIRALQKQNVAAKDIALYSTPQLWTHDMPRDLENVQYLDDDETTNARIIVTSRKHAGEIAPQLASLRKVDEFRMIGKWFDVYRR